MLTWDLPSLSCSFRKLLIAVCLIVISFTASLVMAQQLPPVDATTLDGKVMCGYQAWFRCPDDGTNSAWQHWSRRPTITPQSMTFQMWPDLSEFTPSEMYAVPGIKYPNGRPAYLYSSVHQKTIQRHFQWMQQYGIDGVFVQRFLVNLRQPSFDTILEHVRTSAKDTGRTFAVCYDLSGYPTERIVGRLTDDWKQLCDERKVTRDERYLDHDGLPVVFIWGLYPDRFSADIAHQLIDFFHQEGPYRATVVGGVPPDWRSESNASWASAFGKLDVISPWNVGNIERRGGKKIANTHVWQQDFAAAQQAGAKYLPVIYPGFDWTNLKGPRAERDTIDRRGGAFFWEQFVAAKKLGSGMAYVAMFDEVDEATAIFKVTNDPPPEANFATYEGLPSDWYLRLTGEGTKMIRGETPLADRIPIQP
ncbi:hypothetical protein C5Y96_22005 [Blastopirellula marina]|uniref:Xylosidase/arabinosidase n=1 Tax=Blastopirellula marina TaxID=124 RepID=A0A2S8F1T4_9BACT|nr:MULTISPECIES: glycoside hydrolase family 71/99-like protein [Pirellulaceae]PQO26126.1 hypothetical protein C5Y96_22005 [Blastopirellula marina]RCS44484.1 hypothetical protein DTL36_22050 [Bremerella cremea]